jgi:dTDP-4-amino-4,6-dideoxygalactose transaminase
MIQVPLVDLRATYLPIKDQIFAEFERIFDQMQLFLGENVRGFEDEFAQYCGASHGLGCSNGTDALTLALKSFEFEPGFEVICPALTFFATIESIVHAGGVPVMVDIDPKTYCIDATKISRAMTSKTKAIVPVHLFGQCADMDPILRCARERDVVVIEDAAQAHGATYRGSRAGSIGDAASFSFYFTKNLGAFGEAGFVTTRHERILKRLQLFRHHGHVSKFEHDRIGYNMRIDELQAAVLRAKLPDLDRKNERRREIARQFDESLATCDLICPFVPDDVGHNFHCYVIQTAKRDELVQHLADCGVGTGIHYRTPVHLQPGIRTIEHRAMPMQHTEAFCGRCVTLPCYPELADDQIDHVIDSVRRFFA